MHKKIADPISYRIHYRNDPWFKDGNGFTRPVYRDVKSRVSYIPPQTQNRLAGQMETHAELARSLAAVITVLDTPETEDDECVFCRTDDHKWTDLELELLEYINTLVGAILGLDKDQDGKKIVDPSFPDRKNARAFFYGIDPNRP